MNDGNDIRDGWDDLGIICYFKVIVPFGKWYSLTWKW
jgi:hypothetical protein